MDNLKKAVASALAILNPHGRALGEEGQYERGSSSSRGDQSSPAAHPASAIRAEIANERSDSGAANVSVLKHPGQPLKR
jgi:hypothetical protein